MLLMPILKELLDNQGELAILVQRLCPVLFEFLDLSVFKCQELFMTDVKCTDQCGCGHVSRINSLPGLLNCCRQLSCFIQAEAV